MRYNGSCHCGAVRFEVEYDVETGASRCNCTICTKVAATRAVVKPDAFSLLTDDAGLGQYAWGEKTATRYFCKQCGVHVFARGFLEQVGGDYVAISLNCLDDFDVNDVKVGYWDGRNDNWQAGPRDQPWPVKARS